MQRLLPFIALLVAIGLFFLYVRPTYSGVIADTKQKIASYDSALAAADRFNQKEAQLTQAKAKISPDSLARLNEFLPDGVDNVQLILDLDALAARSGMTLSNFDIQNQDTSGNTSTAQGPSGTIPQTGLSLSANTPVDSLDLTFKGTGTYASFRTFLAGMENSLRPLDVMNLNVQESGTGVYQYDMTVRIYWLR